jgi:alkylation response protein AidB-like acyl-CoA dehydrogenase
VTAEFLDTEVRRQQYRDSVASFRAEVRDFILEQCPASLRYKIRAGQAINRKDWAPWQAILCSRGWAAPNWPVAYGGAGWDARQRFIFDETLAENDVPPPYHHGIYHIGPVLLRFGTDEQRRRFLPGILNGTDWWCQGYSEPGAGSDLASLKTRAERRGDVYVVNGQKIWTSHAHDADWMYALVRTDSSGKKQLGITMLLIRMDSPGLQVRKIRTTDGWHHVNEVFFDDVRVPVTNRVGEEGAGWSYGKYLLEQERINVANAAGLFRQLEKIRQVAAQRFAAGVDSSSRLLVEEKLLNIEAELRAHREMGLRTIEKITAGIDLGIQPSVLKIVSSRLAQRLSEVALDLADAPSVCLPMGEESGLTDRIAGVGMMQNFLYLRSRTIVGGTTEIQKNVIARALLG